LQSFETEILAEEENFAGLAGLKGAGACCLAGPTVPEKLKGEIVTPVQDLGLID
jgi:hypothetical protein